MSDRVRDAVAKQFMGSEAAESLVLPTVGGGWDPPRDLVEGSEFHWFHPPAQGSTFLCVLSRDPLWYAGHYTQGRMKLCRSRDCELCLMGVGRQIRFVFCCVDLKSQVRGILEVGSVPGEQLRNHAMRNGGLRGTVLTVSRASRSKHSRIVVDVIDEVAPGWTRELGSLDLQIALHQTWARMESFRGSIAHTSEGP